MVKVNHVDKHDDHVCGGVIGKHVYHQNGNQGIFLLFMDRNSETNSCIHDCVSINDLILHTYKIESATFNHHLA